MKRVFTTAEGVYARETLDQIIDVLPKPERKKLTKRIERLARFVESATERAGQEQPRA